MPYSWTAGNKHEFASAAVQTEMRCPSLGVSSPFVKLQLKEGYGSPAPRATESIPPRARHCCGDCAALTLFGIDHRLGENNLGVGNNQTALLLAAPEWKDGQTTSRSPICQLCCFHTPCKSELPKLSCKTQTRSYLNSRFSSTLKKSDFSQAVQQKELYLSVLCPSRLQQLYWVSWFLTDSQDV